MQDTRHYWAAHRQEKLSYLQVKMYYKVYNEINYNVQIQLRENHVLKLLKSLKHSSQLGTAQRTKSSSHCSKIKDMVSQTHEDIFYKGDEMFLKKCTWNFFLTHKGYLSGGVVKVSAFHVTLQASLCSQDALCIEHGSSL